MSVNNTKLSFDYSMLPEVACGSVLASLCLIQVPNCIHCWIVNKTGIGYIIHKWKTKGKMPCRPLVCAYTSMNVYFFETDCLLYTPITIYYYSLHRFVSISMVFLNKYLLSSKDLKVRCGQLSRTSSIPHGVSSNHSNFCCNSELWFTLSCCFACQEEGGVRLKPLFIRIIQWPVNKDKI